MPPSARPRWLTVLLCGGCWLISVASAATMVVFDHRLRSVGRSDLALFTPETAVLVAAIASSLIVGTALAWRRPEHPVGWLFLALGTSILAAGVIDGYAAYGALARPGSLVGADLAAHIGDITFVPWLVIIALVLHLTPTGRPLSPRWGWIAGATIGCGVVAVVSALVGEGRLQPPFAGVDNPWALHGLRTPAAVLRGITIPAVGVGLLAAGVSMVLRHHHATGTDKQQLRWLFLTVVPLPLFVPAAFVSAWLDHSAALLIATGGFIVAIPVAAGLAISRFHLYDVDRILSRTLTYGLLSASLVATYTAVVVTTGRALSGRIDASAVSAVVGTLVAVSVAAPLRSAIQSQLDRRFNRRRFEAVRFVDDRARDAQGMAIDDIVRSATADPTLAVAYPCDDNGQAWCTAEGAPVIPDADAVEVWRDGVPIARIGFDPAVVSRGVVEAVAHAAAPALDNARLRAAISIQLVEVNESRARIAAAQTAERRRLERDLHDGAQQRLLAVAMNLRAAHLNGVSARLRHAVADGIDEIQTTVRELRDLANGLIPSALSDGGLGAALDDLARRSPVQMDIKAVDVRFDADLEACAWLAACEAIANAHKHSGAAHITVDLAASTGWLDLTVVDNGKGGADPHGRGLQGMRDRIEAAGGVLVIADVPSGGTSVHARLPCGS